MNTASKHDRPDESHPQRPHERAAEGQCPHCLDGWRYRLHAGQMAEANPGTARLEVPGLTNASATFAPTSQVMMVRPLVRMTSAITSAVNPTATIDGIRMYSSAAAQPCVKRSAIVTPRAVIRTVPMSARVASAVSRPENRQHPHPAEQPRLAVHRDADRVA